MSTRGTTYWDDDNPQPDWHVDPRPWCRECCVPNCGCPALERLMAEEHIIRGSE